MGVGVMGRRSQEDIERAAVVQAKRVLIATFKQAREDGRTDSATYWLGKPNRPSTKFFNVDIAMRMAVPSELVYFADDIYDAAFAKGEAATREALREIAAREVQP